MEMTRESEKDFPEGWVSPEGIRQANGAAFFGLRWLRPSSPEGVGLWLQQERWWAAWAAVLEFKIAYFQVERRGMAMLPLPGIKRKHALLVASGSKEWEQIQLISWTTSDHAWVVHPCSSGWSLDGERGTGIIRTRWHWHLSAFVVQDRSQKQDMCPSGVQDWSSVGHVFELWNYHKEENLSSVSSWHVAFPHSNKSFHGKTPKHQSIVWEKLGDST